jgi:glycosyltransferase involved in cell wall biosynthesis
MGEVGVGPPPDAAGRPEGGSGAGRNLGGKGEDVSLADESAASAPPEAWPSLTAIVPTRDRPVLLRRALRAILDQDYAGPLTCLVVFDKSEPTDLSDVQVPAGRSLRVLTNVRKPGLAGGRNTGILAADTDLVAFCDDDDEWLPGKVQAQVELLRSAEAAGHKVGVLSSGILVNFHEQDTPRLPPEQPLDFREFLLDRHTEVHPCTVLAVREAVLGPIGLVDEDLPGSYAEDYEWLLRAARYAPVRCVPRPLTRVYWHSASFFTAKWEMIRDALTYLLEQYPEFRSEPRGLARIEGQIAFAHAGLGDRAAARRMALQTLRHDPREKRGYVALLVSTGLVKADWVLRLAHRTGRGV